MKYETAYPLALNIDATEVNASLTDKCQRRLLQCTRISRKSGNCLQTNSHKHGLIIELSCGYMLTF